MDSLLSGNQNHIWSQGLSNEWGRLALGNDMGVQGTVAIKFIHEIDVLLDCDVTYATFVLDFKPLKAEQHRIRVVVGSDRI